MKPFSILIIVLLFFSQLPLFSQAEASISYAEGRGFQLVRDGESSNYDIMRDDVIGLPLQVGDLILTDEGSYVEIKLNNGDGGVIKLAENTTFTVSSLDGNGGGVFKLLFGRVRVKVAALTGGSRLWINGYDTVAGVRGTDFGYDLFYDIEKNGGERQTTVYCFEGAVDVIQYDKKNLSKTDLLSLEPFVLDSGKMVQTKSSTFGGKLKSVKIDESISSYWDHNPIVTVVGVPLVNEEKLEVSENLNLSSSTNSKKQTYETGGKILFASGIGMMTIAGFLKAFLPSDSTVSSLSIGLLAIGGSSVLAGGGMMIYSFSLP